MTVVVIKWWMTKIRIFGAVDAVYKMQQRGVCYHGWKFEPMGRATRAAADTFIAAQQQCSHFGATVRRGHTDCCEIRCSKERHLLIVVGSHLWWVQARTQSSAYTRATNIPKRYRGYGREGIKQPGTCFLCVIAKLSKVEGI